MVNAWSAMISSSANKNTLKHEQNTKTDHLEHVQSACEHFPRQTAEVSESALNEAPSNDNCRRPGKTLQSERARPGMRLKCGRNIEMGISITGIYLMAENERQLRAEYSILPV